MKSAPTLLDHLYRASFNKQRNEGWTDNVRWRDVLRRARKFVLDDEMSTFLGELGTLAFVREKLSPKAKFKVIEHLRMGARLPSEITWVEYNLRKCQARSNELLGREFDPDGTPEREGWLLIRHPHLETAFQAIVITHDTDVDHGDGFDTWTFPVALSWVADMDTVMPWKPLLVSPESAALSEITTGLIGYKTDRATVTFSDLVVTPDKPGTIAGLLQEWSGVQRRIWALLATINDLPVLMQEVKPSRGFMGARNYHKFLAHKTVVLNVPQKLYRKTARNALAMAHRRGHPVRGHWRHDWHNPLYALCDHEFGADEKHMFCTHCKGRKIWIRDHERGDASRGFSTIDYRVKHDID